MFISCTKSTFFSERLIEINDNDKLASADQESFAKNL